MLRWLKFPSFVLRVTALMLALAAPAARAVPFPATWIGGTGDWLALEPGAWAIVDFSSPWKFFPDNDGSEYFLVFIPNGHVHLNEGVVPGELGVPVPFLGVEVSTLALDTGAELTIGGSGSLTVNGIEGVGSLITNQGRITLDGAGSLAAPFAMSILGEGEIALESDEALLTGLGIITHDAAHTLSGFGNVASSVFVNEGLVIADMPTRALRFTGLQVLNGGTLRAGGRVAGAAGGELRLESLASLVNDGEVIAENGLVKIESTDIDNGGDLGAKLLGTVILEDVEVDNHGRLFVDAGGAFQLRGDNLIDGGQLDAAPGARFSVQNGRTELTGVVTLTGELAAEGGTLRFRNVDLAMQDGTVHLAAGTLSDALVGNTFHGGHWTGSGRLNVLANSTWDGTPGTAIDETTIALATALHRWRGSFVNDGTIALEETSFNSTLRFMLDGPTRFTGTGRIQVALGDANRFEAGTGDARLINGPTHTLAVAAGAAGTVDVGLDNEGFVEVAGPGASLLVQRDVKNTGVMSAAGGGTLKFVSPLTTGLVIDNAGGRIEALAGGSVLFGDGHPLSSMTTLRGGTLGGPGELRGLNAMALDGVTAGAVTLEDGATLVRAGGTTIAFGTLINDGVLKLEDTTGFLGGASRLAVSGTWQVDGAGEILMSGNSETLINGTDGTAKLVLGAAQRLHTAAGTLATVDVALENHGEVLGAGAGSTLLLQRGVTNRGRMAGQDGGTLKFVSPLTTGLVIDNAGGRIEALAGGSVLFGDGHPLSSMTTLRGGTLGGPGELRGLNAMTLDGVTSGAITLEDGATLVRAGGTTIAFGTLVNDGVLKLEDTTGFLGGASRLAVSGEWQVDGDGEILLSGNTETLIDGTDATALLVLGAGQRLRTAANTFGSVNVALENHGEVIGEGANSTLNLRGPLTNRGLFAARGGGTLRLEPGGAAGLLIDNVGGRIEADAGATVQFGGGHPLSPATTLRGGTLGGAGALLSGTGLVLDGATSGAITVEDGTTLTRTGGVTTVVGTLMNEGVLQIEDTTGFLGGASRLAIAGTVNVNGAGEIKLVNNTEALVNGTDGSAKLILGAGQRLHSVANTSATVDVALENHGEVLAHGLNSTLFLQRDITNHGVIAARDGGTLIFNPSATIGLVIENAGGRIEAATGATVQLGGGHPSSPATTLRGGTLGGAGFLRGGTGLVLDGVTSGAITLEDGATLLRSGGVTTAVGTLVNEGVLKIEDLTGFLSGPSRLAIAGTVNVNGAGEILLSGNTEALVNGTDGSAKLILGAGQRLHSVANTSGTVDVTLENHGEVLAHGTNSTLFVQRNVTNLGVIAARDGGTLHFNPSTTAGLVIENAGGHIEADAGATVQLGGGHPASPATTLRGGTLGGAGFLRSATSLVLDGATSGAITLEAGATLRRAGGTTFAVGTIVNDGTLLIEDTTGFLSGNARLTVSGELRLEGQGRVRFAQGDEMLIDGTAPGARLVLGSGQTLGGQANTFGTVNVVVENHGRVQAEGANATVLMRQNVINRGVLAAQAGATLRFSGASVAGIDLDNHGGRLETAAGSVIALSPDFRDPFTRVRGGVIAGHGRVDLVNATLSEGVVIAPGSSAGTLTFGGNLDFDPIGALDIELGGLNAGIDYDRVVVTGRARLDGRLDLDLLGGFKPGDADVFRILTAASVIGAFDNVENGLVSFLGGTFEVVVGTTFVDLRHFTPAPVPLPAPFALFGLALAALALKGRRARD